MSTLYLRPRIEMSLYNRKKLITNQTKSISLFANIWLFLGFARKGKSTANSPNLLLDRRSWVEFEPRTRPCVQMQREQKAKARCSVRRCARIASETEMRMFCFFGERKSRNGGPRAELTAPVVVLALRGCLRVVVVAHKRERDCDCGAAGSWR